MKIKNLITDIIIISFIITACGKREEKINLAKTKKSKKQIINKTTKTNHIKNQTNIISSDVSKNNQKPSQYEIVEKKQLNHLKDLEFKTLSDKEIKSILKKLLDNNNYEEIRDFLQSETFFNLENDLHYMKDIIALYSNLIEKARGEEESYNAQLSLGSFYCGSALVGNIHMNVATEYLENFFNKLTVSDANNIPNYIIDTKAIAMVNLLSLYRMQKRPLKDMFLLLDETKELNKLTKYNPTFLYEESFYNQLANEALYEKNIKWSDSSKRRIAEFLKRHPNSEKYNSLKNILK